MLRRSNWWPILEAGDLFAGKEKRREAKRRGKNREEKEEIFAEEEPIWRRGRQAKRTLNSPSKGNNCAKTLRPSQGEFSAVRFAQGHPRFGAHFAAPPAQLARQRRRRPPVDRLPAAFVSRAALFLSLSLSRTTKGLSKPSGGRNKLMGSVAKSQLVGPIKCGHEMLA